MNASERSPRQTTFTPLLGRHRPQSHMKLLASVNRRVADKTVSPYCHVAFIPASDYFTTGDDSTRGPQSQTFVEHGESVPFKMPLITDALRLTSPQRSG